MNKEDITETQWRDCYYIYRAMHDGVCPECGHHDEGEFFKFDKTDHGHDLKCPRCGFHMYEVEIQAITEQSSKILKRRLESFHRVRNLL